MFASYNQERSVWVNPVTGMLNSLLIFLKDQVRSWLSHVVHLIGGRRISPLFATQRDIGAQFFTQEYEGRECDISLIPWHSHRSLLSAFLHLLYNPSTEEYFECIRAAERETWKSIPAIKSHIAEEITLDRCVQRLRKRLMAEAWAKRRSESGSITPTGTKTIGDRVPSFFTSPSLVNLGGLGVSDQTNLGNYDDAINANGGVHSNGHHHHPVDQTRAMPHIPPLIHGEPSPKGAGGGWGGKGLQGNRSGSSLDRNLSQGSGLGLFIEEDETPLPSSASGNMLQLPGEQMAGEQQQLSGGGGVDLDGRDAYFKTTSMAKFYYRKTLSYSEMRKSHSEVKMDVNNTNINNGGVVGPNGDDKRRVHARKKSCSQNDLRAVSKVALHFGHGPHL